MHVEQAPAPRTPVRLVLQLMMAVYALFHLYTSLFGTYPELIQRGIFIGAGVALVFLLPLADSARFGPREMLLLAAGLASVYAGVHVAIHSDRLMDIMNDMSTVDMVLAGVFIALILEGSRRSLGWSMPIMALLGLIYYLWGDMAPFGDWTPPRVSIDTALSTLYGSTNGIFGYMADIGTRVIAIYVIFGSILIAVGAGDVFMKTATVIAGRHYGGQAKVAVVTSAMFGTVSGSAVANVMSVGSITIPTMIRSGYRKDLCAGIEASASAGGQIMPPVMGAGAFIMAELLNVPYATVAIAAIVPAIMYFAAIYFSIDCYARRAGLHPIPKHEMPRVRDILLSLDTATAFMPLFLLGYLLFSGYTPTYAGAVATIVLVLFAAAVRLLRWTRAVVRPALGPEVASFANAIWLGIVDGGKGLIAIATLLACSGLVVTILTSTGLAVKFSQVFIGFSGEDLLAVLIMSALLCILLGMDLPTTASYILTASVAAPTLMRLGLDPIAGHMFIFYFAILSAITPPVCTSVFAAATIANEDFWKVAWQALRVAGAVYFIPFMFVYRPELLLNGSIPAIAYNIAIVGLAIAAFGGGSMGYLLGRLSWFGRIYLFAVAGILLIPTLWLDLIGLAAFSAFVAWQFTFGGKPLSAGRREAVRVL